MKRANNQGHAHSIVIIFVVTLIAAVSFANEGSNTTANGWNAPETTKTIQNPFSADITATQKGKEIFAQQCATCHGNSGKGDGPAGKYLGKPLPNFTGTGFQEQSDGEIFWKITTGKAPMPAFEKLLVEKQRWQLINFIRTLSEKS